MNNLSVIKKRISNGARRSQSLILINHKVLCVLGAFVQHINYVLGFARDIFNQITKLCSYVIISFLIFSCEIINPEEDIPAYIRIDTFQLETNTLEQGTNSHKITDVWINIDGNFIGVFELPATFPVLAEGTHEVTIRAGIKVNGIAASRAIFPFYTHYIIDTNLTPELILQLSPKVEYSDETIFAWKEDFEAGLSLDTTSISDIPIIQSNSVFFEGNKAGAIIFYDNHTIFECKSHDAYELPKDNSKVFLELNYKNNNEFVIGVFANKLTQSIKLPIINIYPSGDKWNKIYIDLTYTTTSNPDAINFNIFIGAIKDENITKAEIYLDNIKLVHL